MARIHCPGCGRVEEVDLQGRYLVKCDQCQKEFVAYILKHKPLEQVNVTCPQCGAIEPLFFSGPGKLKVTCQQCGSEFVFSKEAVN